MGRETPVLVDLKPTGQHYMEDLYKAGGLTPILRELGTLLERDCLTVTGQTLGQNIDAAPAAWPQDVVRTMATPVYKNGAMAVLRGNRSEERRAGKASGSTGRARWALYDKKKKEQNDLHNHSRTPKQSNYKPK